MLNYFPNLTSFKQIGSSIENTKTIFFSLSQLKIQFPGSVIVIYLILSFMAGLILSATLRRSSKHFCLEGGECSSDFLKVIFLLYPYFCFKVLRKQNGQKTIKKMTQKR